MARGAASRSGAAIATLALALSACIPSVGGVSRDYPPPPPPPSRVDYPPARGARTDSYQRRSIDGSVEAPETARPAWEARPATADARMVPDSSYVVVSGDTLRGIADRTGASLDAIARANNVEPPYVIRIGERLTIPGGRYHLVRPGQSGIAIARAYGIEWSRIVAANDLTEPYILRAGQRIVIPGSVAAANGAGPSAQPATAERAAAVSPRTALALGGGR
ncbi:MAG: LysM domain-containing protein, partial [Sphingomonas bacterium]|nr:LysM domain-containing protein [Sphingomonas bacterium]